ncbi:MAG: hypothetical protein ACPG4T_10800 [Nannocystaceae bacterium]
MTRPVNRPIVEASHENSDLGETPEGRRAIALLVGEKKGFVYDLALGSVGRVVRAALLWSLGFLAIGVGFQLFGVHTQDIGGLFRVAQFGLIVVLFPLVGFVSGAFWGVYRSLMLQVEAVEKAVSLAIEALLAKVSQTVEIGGVKLGQSLGVERFTAILDEKVEELVSAASPPGEGFFSRALKRLPRWMLEKLLGSIRSVIVGSFLKEEKSEDGSKGSVSLQEFTAFMQEKALSLAFEGLKNKIALLRLVPLLGLILFVAVPLIFTAF